MKNILISVAAAAVLLTSGWTNDAGADCPGYCPSCCHHYCRSELRNNNAYWQSQSYPWHAAYYDTGWGMPVSVVVPPTAGSQTHWGWGVGATRVTAVQHQFQRDYPGPGTFKRACFQPAPRWPSSTDQLGDYYIRGPW
jgi:hypothetical protein